MHVSEEHRGALGLLLVALCSAVQYGLINTLPQSASGICFLFLTNLLGLLILLVTGIGQPLHIGRRTLLRGLVLAFELVGFGVLLIPCARNLEPRIISGVVSLCLLPVIPVLPLLRRHVGFRGAVAATLAVIAGILIFDEGIEYFRSIPGLPGLLLCDGFLAAYLITAYTLSPEEDPRSLSLVQLACSAVLCGLLWGLRVARGQDSFSLPAEPGFWLSVLFFALFLRAGRSLTELHCLKRVTAVNAALIYSGEAALGVLCSPLLSRITGSPAAPVTLHQLIGVCLFLAVFLVTDDGVMARIGYSDLLPITYVDRHGVTRTRSTVSRKITGMILITATAVLAVSTLICAFAIGNIKRTALDKSTELGTDAANVSEEALKDALVQKVQLVASDKALLAEAKLKEYLTAASYAADQAAYLYNDPAGQPEREVPLPRKSFRGRWAYYRILASRDLDYLSLRQECALLGNLEPVLASVTERSDNICSVYVGTRSGLLLNYDPDSSLIPPDVVSYYDYYSAPWYRDAEDHDGPYFTRSYQDHYGRGLAITCVAPIRDSQGRFRGAVGVDILINDLREAMLTDRILNPRYTTLLDGEGGIIASREPDDGAGENADFENTYSSILRSPELFTADEGVIEIGSGSDASLMAYSRIRLTDWVLCIVCPVSGIVGPALEIRQNITGHTAAVNDFVDQSIHRVVSACLSVFALVILQVTWFSGRLSGRITAPLQQLEEDVNAISRGSFDRQTAVTTDDEIGSLAESFNHMTGSIRQYVADLKEMSAREERIASELSLARNIQHYSLPRNFEELERPELELFATMTPAKEVGGDFYDCFLVDEDHMALVIADVSGKGVPAALFMMIAKTLLKSAVQMGLSPREVLENINARLCEGNQAEMFVTVWLGLLELSTGKMTCANAGHEYPALGRQGEGFTLFRDPHGFVLGGMPGMRYRQYELTLAPGDRLFVYTDGVTEATDRDSRLFGTEGLLTALNAHGDRSCRELLPLVKESIDAFAGSTPQFDDITMLCIRYRGSGGEQAEKTPESR